MPPACDFNFMIGPDQFNALCLPDIARQTATAAEFKVAVKDQTLHRIDRRLFGQFMERASWGEPGPEAFADSVTGQLPQQRNIAV
jgi:hypothetical protein